MSLEELYHTADDRLCKECGHWADGHFQTVAADHDHMWCNCRVTVGEKCEHSGCGCSKFVVSGLHGRGRGVKNGWCHRCGTCRDHQRPKNKRYKYPCTCFSYQHGYEFQNSDGSIKKAPVVLDRCDIISSRGISFEKTL